MNIVVKYIFVLTLWGGTLLSVQAQKLTVSEIEMASGQTSSFVVSLKEAQPNTYNALSFSILCPEGMNIVGEPLLTDLWINPFCVTSNEMVLPVSSAMEQYESLMFYGIGDMDQSRTIKMAAASATPLPGTEVDNFLTVDFKADATITPNQVYTIKLQNIQFEYEPKGKDPASDISIRVRVYKLGDADKDEKVAVSDATDVISYILGNGTDAYNVMLADMNNDGVIDIFDIMKLINVILTGKLPDTSAPLMARAAENRTYEDLSLAFSANGVTMGIPNAERFTSFQFEVEVSDDVELTAVELVGASTNHMVQFVKIDENYYRVMGLSMDNSLLNGNNSNNLIDMEIPKCGKLSIHNVMFVTPQGKITYFNDLDLEDGITGVRRINNTTNDQSVYDLLGRKVQTQNGHLPKGVYIINHKRVVVK